MKILLLKSIIIGAIALSLVACHTKSAQPIAVQAVEQQTETCSFTLPTIPTMMTDADERARYLVTHYWDCFDFADTTCIHTPDVTEQALVNFIDLMNYVPTDVAKEAITKTLKEANVNSKMVDYFWETLSRYWYDPNSPLRNEDFYIMTCQAMQELSLCNEALKSRIEFTLNMAQKNRRGMKAADFLYTQATGKQATLWATQSPYTLLFFYNPDCENCESIKQQIEYSQQISQLLTNGQLKIIALYPDEDWDTWYKHKDELPESWINAYDKEQLINTKKLYDLRAIPCLYLLDKEKKVLLKDARLSEVEDYLQSIES